MNEGDWIIVLGKYDLFLRDLGRLSKSTGQMVPCWTVHLAKARFFPSESAATAVIEEWGLETSAEPMVLCQNED